MDRAVVMVDLDHTLTRFLEALVSWHNAKYETKLTAQSFTSDKFETVFKCSKKEMEEKMMDFFHSEQFVKELAAIEKANDVMQQLRRYFAFLVITDRPRIVEKQTREWLDNHFPGVFEKLVFVDEDTKDDVIPRKKELFEDFKVKLAIGSDRVVLEKSAEDLHKAILVGSVLWRKSSTSLTTTTTTANLVVADDWTKVEKILQDMIKELELKPAEKIFQGRKLSKYTDDLVTVSRKKTPAFYANIILSKFSVQKQETIRLQATEDAIVTAIQAAEILKAKNNVTVSKISTRYRLKLQRGFPPRRVPKIELILERPEDLVTGATSK